MSTLKTPRLTGMVDTITIRNVHTLRILDESVIKDLLTKNLLNAKKTADNEYTDAKNVRTTTENYRDTTKYTRRQHMSLVNTLSLAEENKRIEAEAVGNKTWLTELQTYFTGNDDGGICSKKQNPTKHDFSESSIADHYMGYILKNIYDTSGNVRTNTSYRLFVTVSGSIEVGGVNSIVNVLVYKKGCGTKINSGPIIKNPIQLTIICQNSSFGKTLGNSSYILLTKAFIEAATTGGYSHVILEVASTNEYFGSDLKTKLMRQKYYGYNASIHLLGRYATFLKFKEDPGIALTYTCFDKLYPYNSMVLDLNTIGVKDEDERLKQMFNIMKGLKQIILNNNPLEKKEKEKAIAYLKDMSEQSTYNEIHGKFKSIHEWYRGQPKEFKNAYPGFGEVDNITPEWELMYNKFIKIKIKINNTKRKRASSPPPSPPPSQRHSKRIKIHPNRYGGGGVCSGCGKQKRPIIIT
jgi:hypothetical protein